MPLIHVYVSKVVGGEIGPDARGKCSRDWIKIVSHDLGFKPEDVEVIWTTPETWINPLSMEIHVEYSVTGDFVLPEYVHKRAQVLDNLAQDISLRREGVPSWGITGIWIRPIMYGVYAMAD